MVKKDKNIDAYIAKSADFAKPILVHLRALIHQVCPDVEEKTKWGFPHFDYHGQTMCSVAAFKQHCAFGFWKASLLNDPKKVLEANKASGGSAMGNFGRITSLNDLPNDKYLTQLVKQAMKLNAEGITVKKSKKVTPKELVVPDYILAVLTKNKKANTIFEGFSYSHKKEYVQWITEAKTEETRNKRIKTMLGWLVEGKHRHWKYKP